MKEPLKYMVKILRGFTKCLMVVSEEVKRANNIYCNNGRCFSELKKNMNSLVENREKITNKSRRNKNKFIATHSIMKLKDIKYKEKFKPPKKTPHIIYKTGDRILIRNS